MPVRYGTHPLKPVIRRRGRPRRRVWTHDARGQLRPSSSLETEDADRAHVQSPVTLLRTEATILQFPWSVKLRRLGSLACRVNSPRGLRFGCVFLLTSNAKGHKIHSAATMVCITHWSCALCYGLPRLMCGLVALGGGQLSVTSRKPRCLPHRTNAGVEPRGKLWRLS